MAYRFSPRLNVRALTGLGGGAMGWSIMKVLLKVWAGVSQIITALRVMLTARFSH
jgi:hypothetical protein